MILLPERAADRDSRLDEALGAYFADAAAGRVTDRRDLIARHPDLAADLERFFADDDTLDQLLSPLRPARVPSPAVGTVLGDYDLLEVIGVGGTGIVYRARQRSLNRPVALKMVRGGTLATPEGVRRFRAEAETVAALDHPSIVPLYEVGEHTGQLFFTMKLLTGGDLSRWFTGEMPHSGSGTPNRSPAAAARMMVEVARAVHHAHQRGVLHRDLKPSNVLLDADGRPHVADFGLAKWLTGDAGLTETGALVGTPSYMAPEQAAPGRRATLTTATDVYGLGGILYHLLTGRAPFCGATPFEIVTQVRECDPEPPTRANPAVGRDLETVCLKCLRKEPEKRYGSAEALADDLERWLRGEPVTARRAGRLERAARWCRRNPVVATLVGTVALLLLAALGGLTAGVLLLGRETEEKEKQRRAADETSQRLALETQDKERQRAAAVEGARALRREVYLGDLREADDLWQTADVGSLRRLLEKHLPRPGEEDDRGLEWHYLRRLGEQTLTSRSWARCPGAVYGAAFSPDGGLLAAGGAGGFVRLWEYPSGRQLDEFQAHSGQTGHVAFSPDGRVLATAGGDGKVRLWDVAKRRAPIVCDGYSRNVDYAVFSRDGRLLATAGDDHWIRLFDGATGRPRGAWVAHDGHRIDRLALSPDARLLASCAAVEPVVQVWELRADDTGAIEARPRFGRGLPASGPYAAAFSHDGRLLATAEAEGNVRLFDALSGHELVRWHVGRDMLGVRFTPQDRAVVAIGAEGEVRQWDLATRRLVVAAGVPIGRLSGGALTPDGRTLALGNTDGTIRLVDVPRDGLPQVIPIRSYADLRLSFAPDGRTLVVVDRDAITTHEVGTWRQLGARRRGEAWTVACLPDGGGLVAAVGGGQVVLRDRTLTETIARLQPPAFTPYWLAAASGSPVLAAGSQGGALRVWDRKEAPGRDLTPPGGLVLGHPGSALALSHDGGCLAAVCGGTTPGVWVCDPAVGAWRRVQTLSEPAATWLDISRDGRRIAAVTNWYTTVSVCDVATGKEETLLTGHTEGLCGVAFTPDGRRLITAGGREIKFWHLATGRQVMSWTLAPQHRVQAMVLSPDGRYLAVGTAPPSGEGQVLVWDVGPGKQE